MDKMEFADKLEKIADLIEKTAASVEADSKRETEKTAAEAQAKQASEFGFGELGAQPSKGLDPLLDFCMS